MSALTFTRVTQTHDEAAGQVTPASESFAAAAISMEDHEVFRQFGVITSNQVALMATTLPGVDRPRIGDTFVWGLDENGDPAQYTVKDAKPFSPNAIDTVFSYLLGER